MNIYIKAVVHAVFTIIALLIPFLSNGHLNGKEWVNFGLLALGSIGVYWGPNVPGANYTKAIFAALIAGGTVLSTFVLGHVTTIEWIQVVLAGAATLGVYAAGNSGTKNAA